MNYFFLDTILLKHRSSCKAQLSRNEPLPIFSLQLTSFIKSLVSSSAKPLIVCLTLSMCLMSMGHMGKYETVFFVE